jgi:RND family efflux transporter MFP subunit
MWIYRSAAVVVLAAGLAGCETPGSILPDALRQAWEHTDSNHKDSSESRDSESKDTGSSNTGSDNTEASNTKASNTGASNTGSEDAGSQTPARVAAPATIEAFYATDLYAKNAGYVVKINNDIGDHVKKGQILALIKDPELQAQADKAQAAVGQAKATVEVARRELAGLEADLELQRVTLERQKLLYAGRAATAQMVDEAQAKQDVARAAVETGRAKIHLAEADLEAARADLSRFDTLLEYNKIVAPFDGVVTRRLLNPGDLVQAATSTRTTPLFTCQMLDVVRVFAFVPQSSVSRIRVGTRAEVKPYDREVAAVSGTVTRLADALDPATQAMRVEIDLENGDRKLHAGSYARVTLTLDPPRGASQPPSPKPSFPPPPAQAPSTQAPSTQTPSTQAPAAQAPAPPPSSRPPSAGSSPSARGPSPPAPERPYSIIENGGTRRGTLVPWSGASAPSTGHG